MGKCFRMLALIAAMPFLLAACYTVPETGRSALSFVSPAEELQMGAAAFTEIKQTQKVSDDTALNATVNRVGQQIAKVVGDDLPSAQWEFVVFENDTPNAFALPGGKVGVHRGLFKLAENDNELAVVMGHEIAHVTARHGAERMSHSLLLAGIGLGVEAALREKPDETRKLAMTAYGIGTALGVTLPFSRLNESEADEIGLIYAARAGYDPRAALAFWKKMKEQAEGKSKPPEWLSTHPSDDTRIKNLEGMMPRMVSIYEESKKQ